MQYPISAALLLALSSNPGNASSEQRIVRGVQSPDVIVATIFDKLEYDYSYFRRVIRLASTQGPTGDVQKLNEDLKRARFYEPFLEQLLEQRASYEKGQPIAQPGRGRATRVYDNLVGLLNMVQQTKAENYAGVLTFGTRVSLSRVEDLGVKRKGEPRYRLRLLREFYYMMGIAAFREGRDTEAQAWFDRITKDPRMAQLYEASGEAGLSSKEIVSRRLNRLRLSPVAVMPLENTSKKEDIAWMGRGIMEVLTSDLSKYTSLAIVERSQIGKIVEEYTTRYALSEGEQDGLDQISKILDAKALLVGSYQPASSGELNLIIRLVDVSDGLILASVSSPSSQDEIFTQSRGLMIQLLTEIDWVDPVSSKEILGSRAPSPQTVRDLVRARAMMSTEQAEARKLYADAVASDPAYSSLFDELKTEFPEVKSLLAIASFENLSGRKDDDWMVGATSQTLHSDLPKLGFDVIDRFESAKALHSTTSSIAARASLQGKTGATFLIVGGISHLNDKIRIDARMLEVKSGQTLFATYAENDDKSLSSILTTLSESLALEGNQALSEDVVKSLTGRRLTDEELKGLAVVDDIERDRAKAEAEKEAEDPITPKKKKRRKFERRRSFIGIAAGVVGTKPSLQARIRYPFLNLWPTSSQFVVGVTDWNFNSDFEDIRAHYDWTLGVEVTDRLFVDGSIGFGFLVPNSGRTNRNIELLVPFEIGMGIRLSSFLLSVHTGVQYRTRESFDQTTVVNLGLGSSK